MLTEYEKEILRFEADNYRHAGFKYDRIQERLGIGPTRYYQLLNGLLDRQDAVEFSPALVNRLRRLRAERARPAPDHAALIRSVSSAR